MFPFWEMVIAPLVKASGAERVLEIGALRGENTSQMFEQLGARSELHVIDPLPQFDPEEHARQFPGRYVFYRDLSLNVLGDLPPMDVALIDGDHNWYTVYHELKQLAATAETTGQPLPLLLLHDVTWPYGHRDLYYEPSQIPAEFRQPWARQGMAPGFYRLLPNGGFNADLANAIDGGGPRNGVKKALDDFLSEYDKSYRMVVLPIYYGLAIVVDEQRLDRAPGVGKILDQLETSEGRRRLLLLSERIRVDEQVHVHNHNRFLEGQAHVHRDRYLALLKAALLDEHYLENEVRLEYLASLAPGTEPDPGALRDPARTLPVRFDRLADARRAGGFTRRAKSFAGLPYTDIGHAALDHLEQVVSGLHQGIPGDLVECGVGRGGGGVFMRACLEAYSIAERDLWVVGTFRASEGTEAPDGTPLAADLERQRPDLNQIRDAYHRFDLLDDRVRFVQGEPAQSLSDAPLGQVAVLRIGETIGSDLKAVLKHLLPRVTNGGTVIVEGVGAPTTETRLVKARADLGVTDDLVKVDWNTVTWTVGSSHPIEARTAVPAPVEGAHRPALPARIEPDLDLSVVVVFYNMKRESARTLQSLARSYQQGVEDVTYEVIVIDNGSAPDQRLTEAEVRAFGPEFRLVDLAGIAVPSPTAALNLGVHRSRGRAVALMIDGAHVLTPGVLGLGLKAMETYEPAIVATQQWYVGPGQQGDALQAGYDQKAEDKLFDRISWPVEGYRLFEIGHFIGDRDWFDGIVESNCLFVPRSLLEQVGAFDDSFSMPGGGYANLELFERLGAHPGVNAASILGEGSFHQFHGGTTTNVADEAERRNRIADYREHFDHLRGRGLLGLGTPVNYVGAMATKAARRTRSRREITLSFDPGRDPVVTTDTEPTPVPDELKLAAIEALWGHQAWRQSTWMGHRVNRYPTDLHSYQELVHQSGPANVVLVADDDGIEGRARYFASIFDQMGAGRVVAVGAEVPGEGIDHPRVTAWRGDALDPALVAAVSDEVGQAGAVVMIGLGAVERVIGAFDRYASLVPVDGHVVIENTVVNGRPVESSFGPGPHEAVVALLGSRREFVPDVAFERYSVTFNKNGYLRRMAPT